MYLAKYSNRVCLFAYYCLLAKWDIKALKHVLIVRS